MKQIFISDIRDQNEITDFFMAKSLAIKVGSNKKQYLDIVLGDKTGEMSAKKWDVSDFEAQEISKIREGDVIKVRAQVNEWNNNLQLKIMKIRGADENDEIEYMDFVKTAPENPDFMYNFLLERIEKINDEKLKELCKTVYEENKEKLLYYPAAKSNHHAELGGLLYHIKTMCIAGEKLSQVYKNLDLDLLIAGVLLHDIEKINEIDSNEWGIASDYTFEGKMLGHIVQGTIYLHDLMVELGFEEEKMVMVEHMIVSHHYEPDFGSPRKPLFIEAEMLHYLDIMDARMYDFTEAMSKTLPGEFSERVWVLENRAVYKKK
ncbi:MAG: 3'-5' exoribonuclease YhaM family protein [Anaerovoracaceae bacterium]